MQSFALDTPPLGDYTSPANIIGVCVLIMGVVLLVGYLVREEKRERTTRREEERRRHERESEHLSREAELDVRRREIAAQRAAQAIRDEPLVYRQICSMVAAFLDRKKVQNITRQTWQVPNNSASITPSGWKYNGLYTSTKGRHVWVVDSTEIDTKSDYEIRAKLKLPRRGENIGRYQTGTQEVRRDFLVRNRHGKAEEDWMMEEVPTYSDIIVTDVGTSTVRHAYEAVVALIDKAESETP